MCRLIRTCRWFDIYYVKKQVRWELYPKINKGVGPNNSMYLGRKKIPKKNKKCNTLIRKFRVWKYAAVVQSYSIATENSDVNVNVTLFLKNHLGKP